MYKPMLASTDIAYVGECDVDKSMARKYVYAEIGKKVFLPKPGRKFKRINLVAPLIIVYPQLSDCATGR